jgi:hypothetical protein
MLVFLRSLNLKAIVQQDKIGIWMGSQKVAEATLGGKEGRSYDKSNQSRVCPAIAYQLHASS